MRKNDRKAIAMTDKDKNDLTTEVEDQLLDQAEEPDCQTCPEEDMGCAGCSGKREQANTWWYIIALLVILLLALFFRRQGGST